MEETEEEMDEVFYLCRFNPEPAEAVTYYLPRLLPGSPPPPPPLPRGLDRLIHRADVYARSPADLAAAFPPAPKAGATGDRFFLTPRRRIPGRRGTKSARVAGEGTWVIQKTREILDGAGAKVGEVRNLSYCLKKGEATSGWVMEEYRCLLPEAAFADGEMVLCKIHLSRNASAAARRESAAYLLHPPQEEQAVEPVSAHEAPNTKRAAPVPADPPSPKKARVAAPFPIPVPAAGEAAGGNRFTCSMEELLGGGLAAQEAPRAEAGKGVDEFAASLEGFPKQCLAASGSDEVSSSSMAAEDGGELLGRCRNRPQPIIFPLSQLEGYNDFFSCA